MIIQKGIQVIHGAIVLVLSMPLYKKFGDINSICLKLNPGGVTSSLDMGCGRSPRNPFNATYCYGIDLFSDESMKIEKANLAVEKIPYADDFFEFLTAFDFIEHIPRVSYIPEYRFPFVELMNEIYRVLKPGGYMLSVTPAYPFADVLVDPTHVNYITDRTFSTYFDDINRWAVIYGFNGAFKIVKQGWDGTHLVTVLKKVPI